MSTVGEIILNLNEINTLAGVGLWWHDSCMVAGVQYIVPGLVRFLNKWSLLCNINCLRWYNILYLWYNILTRAQVVEFVGLMLVNLLRK